MALFFGAGTLYNRDGREYLVKAFPVYDPLRRRSASTWPATSRCRSSARPGSNWSDPTRATLPDVRWAHPDCSRSRVHPSIWPIFTPPTATIRVPEPGRDLVLLDTRAAEGGGDWSGSFVGTSFIFSDRAALGTLEGDPRFFFDDSQTPQAQGTGTEEWGGGGDYWGGRQHDVALRRPPGRRAEAASRAKTPKTRSNRPTASSCPT